MVIFDVKYIGLRSIDYECCDFSLSVMIKLLDMDCKWVK